MLDKADTLGVENASIITLSTAHLHPKTIAALEACRGDVSSGPSVAVRPEGFLVNSHLGSEDALGSDLDGLGGASLHDRFPDLVLLRAFARGLGAAWLNIDADGTRYCDLLPSYHDGSIFVPTDEHWAEALSCISASADGHLIVVPARSTLEIIEAGQTPGRDTAPGF